MPDKVAEREDQPAQGLRRRGRGLTRPPSRPSLPSRYYSVARRIAARAPGRVPHQPVPQPGQPGGALPHDRPRAVGADRRARSTRSSPDGHRRHDQRHRALPQGEEPEGAGRRRRPGRLDPVQVLPRTGRWARPTPTRSRASARTSCPSAFDFNVIDDVVQVNDRDGAQHGAAAGARGGRSSPAARRARRVGRAREAAQGAGPDDRHRRADARHRRALPVKVHNDEWMRDNHLLDPAQPASPTSSVGKSARRQALLIVAAGDPVRQARRSWSSSYDISQLPVVEGDGVVGTWTRPTCSPACSTTGGDGSHGPRDHGRAAARWSPRPSP